MRILDEMTISKGLLYAHPMGRVRQFPGGNESRPYTKIGKAMRNNL